MMLVPSRFLRRGLSLLGACALVLAAPLAAQAPPNDTCSAPLVISPSAIPYTSPPIDTRAAFNDSGDPQITCGTFTTPNHPNAFTK